MTMRIHVSLVVGIAMSLVMSADARPEDCNWNGVDDACDVSCSAAGCVLPCGESQDCNGNGVPDECDVASVYVGTNAAGTTRAKVYRYSGGTSWTDLTPVGLGQAVAVMVLHSYGPNLYAGVQTVHGYGGASGQGQVWRYARDSSWSLIGVLDHSVMTLAAYDGHLFAATDQGILYQCTLCDGTDWEAIDGVADRGFRSSIVSSICGPRALFLGEGDVDDFWLYTSAGGLIELESHEGSCIWDFAEFENRIYAGAFAGGTRPGPVYATHADPDCNSPPIFAVVFATQRQNWALETFRNGLFVGTGVVNPADRAQLWRFDGSNWRVMREWPTTTGGEGVSALGTYGSSFLLVGLGVPDGYHYLGDGQADLWLFDGTQFSLISTPDFFGAGVQSILVGGFSPDCNSNGILDECEIAAGTAQDCNEDGVPDECFPDCNENGLGDGCDVECGPPGGGCDQPRCGLSRDINGNCVPDECDPDCNANGLPDDMDLADGTSLDCNADGIPDECGCQHNPRVATILHAVPINGTIDARQPHPVETPLVCQGIGSRDDPIYIQLDPPEGRNDGCFNVCETAQDRSLAPNSVRCVTPLGEGRYELVLDHPITAGAVTTIEYVGDHSFVSYISHPGNVNADATADPHDVAALVDCLGGQTEGIHGIYSLDIDHSGMFTPADMLRLIDLLNGGDQYEAWNSSNLPVNADCPAAVGACCVSDGTCEKLSLGRCLYSHGYWDPHGSCGPDYECPLPECVGIVGDCCIEHDTPGCANPQCCTAVCQEDLYCCLVVWDEFCVPIATDHPICLCSFPECIGATGSCCQPNGSPGCSDPSCCTDVCQLAPACCSDPWGEFCAAIAALMETCRCP